LQDKADKIKSKKKNTVGLLV